MQSQKTKGVMKRMFSNLIGQFNVFPAVLPSVKLPFLKLQVMCSLHGVQAIVLSPVSVCGQNNSKTHVRISSELGGNITLEGKGQQKYDPKTIFFKMSLQIMGLERLCRAYIDLKMIHHHKISYITTAYLDLTNHSSLESS